MENSHQHSNPAFLLLRPSHAADALHFDFPAAALVPAICRLFLFKCSFYPNLLEGFLQLHPNKVCQQPVTTKHEALQYTKAKGDHKLLLCYCNLQHAQNPTFKYRKVTHFLNFHQIMQKCLFVLTMIISDV